MSKRFAIVPALLSALVAVAAVPAPAAAAPGAAVPAVHVQQARIFGARGFGRRSPAIGSRYRYRTRSPFTRGVRRPRLFHGLFGGILKALGIAYLFHMLFGIGGGGGSPFGLILLVALLAFAAGRVRRRPLPY